MNPHLLAQMGGIAGLTSAAGLGHLTPSQLAAVSQAGYANTQIQVNNKYISNSNRQSQLRLFHHAQLHIIIFKECKPGTIRVYVVLLH